MVSGVAVAAVIAVSHGAIDAYAAFLHPLLPRIMDKLGLSITLAAALSMSLFIAVSVLQPPLGYLADRYGRRPYTAAGPILAGVFFSLIGLAPTFVVLVVFLVLGGLGASTFHPPAASLAARAGEGRGSGMRFSVFSFGGAIGFAIGPLAAVWLVARFGFEGLWVAMVPGVLLGLVLWRMLPDDRETRAGPPPPHPLQVLRALKGPLGLLFGISAAGAFVQRVFLTLTPIIGAQAGRTEATGAVVLSLYLGAQALGTLAGGALADRVDRRHILLAATSIGVPLHILAVIAPPAGPLAIAAALCAGFLNMGMLPAVVVMAQEIMPEGTAVSSGIVMGLAWVPGSLGVLGAGALADQIGPVGAAAWSMPILLVGTLLALHPALKAFSRAAH
jgi:FSR family fosmidomycin resistance protein-like MFS transporter